MKSSKGSAKFVLYGASFLPRPLLVLIGLAMLLGGCEKAKDEVAPPPPAVDVVEVIQKDVPIHNEWVGTLDGMVNATINAQVMGYLIRQDYKEGDLVRKGQLLYEIDPRPFQAALDQAKSNLARQEAVLKTARLELQRIERLLPEKAVSVRDRDNAVGREAAAQAEVLAASAAVQKARLDLEFTKITSPIDGVAGLSKGQLGDLIGPGSSNAELTTVSRVDPIKAYIPLSEQQYLQFATARQNGERGSSVPLELILADGSTYPHGGKFLFADREVDVKTGTIKLAVQFPNPGSILRPGQFAKIRAVVKEKPGALLVPQRAVTDLQGKSLIAVVNADNTVSMRMVKPAERIDTLWVIDEGLKAGERVIVEGMQKVREGLRVTPKPAEQSPPPGTPASSPKTAR